MEVYVFAALTLFSSLSWAQVPPLPKGGAEPNQCELPLTGPVYTAGEYPGVMLGSTAEAKDPVEDWFRKGVDLHVLDPRVKDRSKFIAACWRRDVPISGKYLVNDHPKQDVKSLSGAWAFLLDPKNADQFKELYGFEPTERNFRILSEVAETFDSYPATPRTHHFPSYTKLEALKDLPASLPPADADGIKGIRDFWNDPFALLRRMDEAKALVDARKEAHPELTTEQAVEQVRHEFEIRHGFDPEILDYEKTIPTNEWHARNKKAKPQLIRDVSGSHSLEYIRHEGQNGHRNQWWLIMLEMEANPARFGSHPLKATELFNRLSDPELNSKIGFEADHSVHGGFFDTKNLWYNLFDLIGDRFTIASPANPFYFNEIFSKRTGFDLSY